jgi:hypothetical protein
MVRVYYGNHHRIERVIFDGGASTAILALEWHDSVVEQCAFLACGSKGLGARTFGTTGTGSGGRPAVLILGDTQTSGTGHTDLGCTGLRFNNNTFDNITDGAVLVHGNTAAEDFAGQVVAEITRFWFTNNKVKSLATGYAPQLSFHRVLNGFFTNNHLLAGAYLSGAGTPENIVEFDTSSILTVTGLQFETQTAQHRTMVRFNNTEVVDCGTILVDDAAPSAPSVALVQLAGTNNYWARQPKVQVRFRNAHTDGTLVSGTTTSCLENRGTATIAVGTTSVVVTHGLPHTPTAGDVLLTATSNPANDPGHIWWDNATTTQFTVNCKTAPTTTALTVAWRAEQLADQGHQ